MRKRPHDASPQDGRRRAQARLIRQEALNSVMGKTAISSAVQAIPLRALCLEYAKQIGAWVRRETGKE
jgi:hypothetical protein